MSERKMSEATWLVNQFIDGKAPAPDALTLAAAATDALCDWHNAKLAGDREAAAWAIDAMRNVADVMEDILDGRGND